MFKKMVKILVIPIIAIICVVVGLSNAPDTKPTETVTLTPTPTIGVEPTTNVTEEPAPEYQVLDVDDISVQHAKRYTIGVVAQFPISITQIEYICKNEIANLKERKAFSAALVAIYDERALYPGTYSIAKCEYAPHGDWGEAVNSPAGAYHNHEFVYDFMPKVTDPQTAMSARPTENEHNLCQQWGLLAATGMDDSEIYAKISNETGIDAQVIEGASNKCVLWAWK